jgi:TRAP-type mannitol/chloroaromatic compound transport system substrate-binding protein
MSRLRSIASGLALASGVLVVAAAGSAQAQEVQWTMTTTWPTSIELIEIDRKWVETVHDIAGDDIRIQFFDGGTLVPPFEIFDAVAQGNIQAGGDWPGYWAGRDSAFSPLATHTSMFNAMDFVLWIQQWGGADLYDEIYGKYGMVYLPYGVTNNESGFRTNKPLASLEDIRGMRLRLSGRDQGKVLERLGGEQVMLAGEEIYQALERGVIDGAEYSTPGVDAGAGFQEVTRHWSVPGWHQSASVFGVMINKAAWDALDEDLQKKLRIAADRTMLWSLAWAERRSNEGARVFEEAGVETNRWSEEALNQVQQISKEVIAEAACENPSAAKVYHSQLSYLQDYSLWREMSVPFNLGRNPELPDMQAIENCLPG